MKTLFNFFLFFLPFVLSAQNFVKITGYTNVNTFSCVNENVFVKFEEDAEQNLPFREVNVRVDDFKCDSKKMTEQFRDMMNFRKNPYIRINVESSVPHSYKKFHTQSKVRINGVEKYFSLPVAQSGRKISLEKRLSIADFRLIPPKVLGGIVKVKDQVDVKINITSL